MFERLNLDDYGNSSFDPDRINVKYDGKVHRARFEPDRFGYSERKRPPFVWQDRMGDWRHLERVSFKLRSMSLKAHAEEWDFARFLWKMTRKMCGKRVKSFYLQILPAKAPKKKEKPEIISVEHDDRGCRRHHKDSILITSCREEKMDPGDARHVWIWMGTPEEGRFNVLRRRSRQLARYSQFAERVFHEALRERFKAWYAIRYEKDIEVGKGPYGNVFVAVENEGRSYGCLISRGGYSYEMAWAPPDKPVSFS